MRITGGALRSRRLLAPEGSGTRPTADRIREALFSIIADRGLLPGGHVADLFAGTGALGLEALSRGAEHATFVESQTAPLRVLRSNVRSLGVESQVQVLPMTVSRALSRGVGSRPLRIVFVDPPYAEYQGPAFGALVEQIATLPLEPKACFVFEHAARTVPSWPELLGEPWCRTYGDTALTFFLREP